MSKISGEERLRIGGWTPALKRSVKPTALVIAVFLLLYYPIGMMWIHTIDDDPQFAQSVEVPEKASRSVAITAALINREINVHRWTANDPFFMPAAALDNMPNFQQGIISALARFAFELTDQIGRTRGSSQADPDLQEAAGLLQYSGTKWVWDPSVSLWPTAATEKQYEKARKSLLAYNARLAAGNAVFDRRSDNLLATLDRMAADLGSSSAALDQQIAEHSGDFIDTGADDLFYGIKGKLYAYYLLCRELQSDFSNVITERELGPVWDQMLHSMRQAAVLDPLIVVNSEPDGLVAPSHLAVQGFYLLRARTRLREITNILLK
jgi:hypothetical protein